GLATLVVIVLVTAQQRQWRWLTGLAASSVLLIWSYHALFGIYFASFFLNGLNTVFQYGFGAFGTPYNYAQSGGDLNQGPPPGTPIYFIIVSLLLVASALPALLYALRLRDEAPTPAAPLPS